MVVYENTIETAEHIALVKGDVSGPDPVLVRVHSVNVLGDLLGDETVGGARADDLHASMTAISIEGRGVVVLIRESRMTSPVSYTHLKLPTKA